MLRKAVENCSILREFTPQEQLKIFGISRQKFLHHIDTLYYSVYINEPKDVIGRQRTDDLPEHLNYFLSCMRECKEAMRDRNSTPPVFGELEFSCISFSMYEWCVSLPECFDIFIGSYLPNENTPRIVVQLRSRYLVIEGVENAIKESFRHLCQFLDLFGLFPVRVRENRIDYAFHTNYIQNTKIFFDDDVLRRQLKTNLRVFSKYGATKDIQVDTLNIGRRSSNNVFFRAYNKSREMIEMNYKSFFIERWYQNGLISEFDKYVYEVAYNMRAYRSGILVGRLKWYLEFGSNDSIKSLCHELLSSDFIRSDNFDDIEDRIFGIIPEPTLIFNVEFQTKRKFFSSCEQFIKYKVGLFEHIDLVEGQAWHLDKGIRLDCDLRLRELMVLIYSTREVVDYLTSYGNTISFVPDNTLSLKEFKEKGEKYAFWWQRLRDVEIDFGYPTLKELYRSYDLHNSLDRTLKTLEGNIARLSILKNQDIKERAFVQDLSDVLGFMNDNDKRISELLNHDIIYDKDGNVLPSAWRYDPKGYVPLRMRRSRQLRGIIRKGEKENTSDNDSE